MEYNVVEFRKNIKEAFDAAMNNDTVTITRGGILFELNKIGFQNTKEHEHKFIIPLRYSLQNDNGNKPDIYSPACVMSVEILGCECGKMFNHA